MHYKMYVKNIKKTQKYIKRQREFQKCHLYLAQAYRNRMILEP